MTEMANITSSAGRPSIERFFTDYFYADYMADPSDLNASLDEYLEVEGTEDPGGKELLAQTDELLARNLNDGQLAELIERWGPNAYLSLTGQRYQPVLLRIRDYLQAP
jgi:hypothetical protein